MKAKDLKNSILQLAIQGKLVPQDPNDEPASKLLEKIRTAKQKLVKEGKIKKDKQESFIYKGDDNNYYEKIGNEVRNITDEIPFEIPDSWVWSRSQNIFSVNAGLSFKKDLLSIKSSNMIRILRGGNIEDNSYLFYDNDLFISKEFIKKDIYLKKNWLITPAVTSIEQIGKIARITQDYSDVVVGGFVLNIIPHYLNEILSKILLNFMLSPYYNQSLKGATHKSGQAFYNLSKDKMGNLLFPLPPLEEQKRIVSKIESLEPFIDDYNQAETELSKLNETFPEQIKKSILQYAIQGKLVPQNPGDEPASVLLEKIKAEKQKLTKAGKIRKDKVESYIYKRDNRHYEKIGDKEVDITDEIPFEIPNNWAWMRLGDIGEWRAGATPSRQNAKYYNGSIPWLKTGDLNDGYITNVEETITELATEHTSAKVRPIGSVLMAMYGATIGKLGILAIPCATNQACCACMPFNGIFNKFLFFYLLAQRRNFIEQGAGGAQPNISREKIIVNLFPLPPLEEQERIVAKVEEILKLLPSNG